MAVRHDPISEHVPPATYRIPHRQVARIQFPELPPGELYGILEYNRGMPRYIELKADVDEKELEKRYRAAREGVERSQWQILWLLRGGKRAREVADLTGYSVVWIRALVKRYNTGGAATIGDNRHKNPGRPLKLNAEQQANLKAEVMKAEAA